MTDAFEWRGRVGDAWAEEWRRTDRTIAPLQPALLDALRPRLAGLAAPRILDIGCGAGATSLALADSIAGATVVGIDLSEALVATARARTGARANLAFEVADAAAWTPADGSRFDAMVSRHGVMFFDDPVAAFRHLRGLGTDEMRLVFSCFRDRSDNAWAAALVPVFARFAPEALAMPPPPIGPFAFADSRRIEAILTEAGFPAPDIAAFDFEFVAGEGDDPVTDAVGFYRRIGPFAHLLNALDPDREAEAVAQLAGILEQDRNGDRIVYRAAAWIVSCASA